MNSDVRSSMKPVIVKKHIVTVVLSSKNKGFVLNIRNSNFLIKHNFTEVFMNVKLKFSIFKQVSVVMQIGLKKSVSGRMMHSLPHH